MKIEARRKGFGRLDGADEVLRAIRAMLIEHYEGDHRARISWLMEQMDRSEYRVSSMDIAEQILKREVAAMMKYDLMYHKLFNAVTDAIEDLQKTTQNLIAAQQEAEELYLGESPELKLIQARREEPQEHAPEEPE